MTGKIKKIVFAALTVTTAALVLSACKGMELENKTEIVEEYTKEQAMIIVANERNKYESIYSGGIWDVAVGEDGSGFDKLTIQNVKQYLEQIKLLCMLAEERSVVVTSQERDSIRQLTDLYMSELTEGDLSYIGCSRDDVQKMYTDLFTADKLLKSITGDIDSDISDSEVKVIKIQQIGVTDLKKAKAILKRIKIDGADFGSMASRYTEADTIERTLMRTDDEDLVEQKAFEMEEGEVSNILAEDDMYYIIHVTDGYAEDRTIDRKERIQRAVNNTAVKAVLDPYKQEHNIKFVERFWNELDFSGDDGSDTQNFFDLYGEQFD